jgi:acyl carrier protein
MAFTVSINGNNYISAKRKARFEEALHDGHRVKLGGNGQKPSDADGHTEVIDQPVQQSVSHPVHTDAQPTPDCSRMFETLELGLKQSYGHQTETLRVHQQYLKNQAEYANIFSQLMQQQGNLFTNGNTEPEKAEITLTVLNSLSRSIEQFHQHQADTLSIHSQFLNQQSAYSQAFVQLLHQQVYGANGDNGGIKEGMEVNQFAVTSSTPSEQGLVSFIDTNIKPASVKYKPVVSVSPPAPAPEPVQVSSEPMESKVIDKTDTQAVVKVIEGYTLSELLLSIVSEKTGYPVEMLELDMDMEADLGIDSIKRVEILGALQDQVTDLPEIDTEILGELRTLEQIISYMNQTEAQDRPNLDELSKIDVETYEVTADIAYPASAKGVDVVNLKASLLDIVSDKTGYPAEMLELDMDMEADLGIDSIKRVEILGALQDEYPGMAEVDTDTLTELHTLQQIIDYIDIREPAEKKV